MRTQSAKLGLPMALWGLSLVAGCSATMKAVQAPGQAILKDKRSAQTEREGVAVVVTPIVVPVVEDESMTGVAIEIVNQSDKVARLAIEDVVLIGGDGMRRTPMDPRRFARYAREATGDAPPYPNRQVQVYVGVGYGGWHYPCAPYYGYDAFWADPYWDAYEAERDYYYRREQMARFVAMLWRTQNVEPGFAAGGCVVFSYKLHRKEQIAVEITLKRVPATQPATAPARRRLEPTTDGPLRFRLLFKT
jgi:hypothetical protein